MLAKPIGLRYIRRDMVSSRMLTLASRYQFATLALLSLISLFIDREVAVALLAGGALMGANFWLMRFLLFKAMGGPKPSVAYALLLALKFGVVLVLLWVLVGIFQLHPTGIALGLLTLFVGIGFSLLHLLLQPKPTT